MLTQLFELLVAYGGIIVAVIEIQINRFAIVAAERLIENLGKTDIVALQFEYRRAVGTHRRHRLPNIVGKKYIRAGDK